MTHCNNLENVPQGDDAPACEPGCGCHCESIEYVLEDFPFSESQKRVLAFLLSFCKEFVGVFFPQIDEDEGHDHDGHDHDHDGHDHDHDHDHEHHKHSNESVNESKLNESTRSRGKRHGKRSKRAKRAPELSVTALAELKLFVTYLQRFEYLTLSELPVEADAALLEIVNLSHRFGELKDTLTPLRDAFVIFWKGIKDAPEEEEEAKEEATEEAPSASQETTEGVEGEASVAPQEKPQEKPVEAEETKEEEKKEAKQGLIFREVDAWVEKFNELVDDEELKFHVPGKEDDKEQAKDDEEDDDASESDAPPPLEPIPQPEASPEEPEPEMTDAEILLQISHAIESGLFMSPHDTIQALTDLAIEALGSRLDSISPELERHLGLNAFPRKPLLDQYRQSVQDLSNTSQFSCVTVNLNQLKAHRVEYPDVFYDFLTKFDVIAVQDVQGRNPPAVAAGAPHPHKALASICEVLNGGDSDSNEDKKGSFTYYYRNNAVSNVAFIYNAATCLKPTFSFIRVSSGPAPLEFRFTYGGKPFYVVNVLNQSPKGKKDKALDAQRSSFAETLAHLLPKFIEFKDKNYELSPTCMILGDLNYDRLAVQKNARSALWKGLAMGRLLPSARVQKWESLLFAITRLSSKRSDSLRRRVQTVLNSQPVSRQIPLSEFETDAWEWLSKECPKCCNASSTIGEVIQVMSQSKEVERGGDAVKLLASGFRKAWLSRPLIHSFSKTTLQQLIDWRSIISELKRDSSTKGIFKRLVKAEWTVGEFFDMLAGMDDIRAKNASFKDLLLGLAIYSDCEERKSIDRRKRTKSSEVAFCGRLTTYLKYFNGDEGPLFHQPMLTKLMLKKLSYDQMLQRLTINDMVRLFHWAGDASSASKVFTSKTPWGPRFHTTSSNTLSDAILIARWEPEPAPHASRVFKYPIESYFGKRSSMPQISDHYPLYYVALETRDS